MRDTSPLAVLNQNSRVLDLAERSSIITEVTEFLEKQKIGIIQMSCPELTYAGIHRRKQTRAQYDTVEYRSHCRKIAKEIVDQIQEYAKCGIKTKIVIGIDGSPSCGVNRTSKKTHIYRRTSKHKKTKELGILIEELQISLKKRNISIPFHGIRYEHLPEDLVEMEELLKD